MILVSSCSCQCPIYWTQGLCREWRCSWSSADRWCSNYIWVINDYIAYKGAAYIRGLPVVVALLRFLCKFKNKYSNPTFKLISSVFPGKLLSCECHRTHWWWVIKGSSNGLVPSGKEPIPEPMLTQVCVVMKNHIGPHVDEVLQMCGW